MFPRQFHAITPFELNIYIQNYIFFIASDDKVLKFHLKSKNQSNEQEKGGWIRKVFKTINAYILHDDTAQADFFQSTNN